MNQILQNKCSFITQVKILCNVKKKKSIHCKALTSDVCHPPQVARQSQLLRGVFPALFHPLPAPVWADDVDNRVNFGMDIGQ